MRFATVCAALALSHAAPTPPKKSGNMNGKYAVSSGGDIGVPFNDDYASKGYEYFDVWAPEIATHYGEVFWTDQGSTPLPPNIVKRFDGKVMAIMGYEQDQVMVTPVGSPGQNPEKDVSVPINWVSGPHPFPLRVLQLVQRILPELLCYSPAFCHVPHIALKLGLQPSLYGMDDWKALAHGRGACTGRRIRQRSSR
eukprot:COSAG05_NODE_779_length_7389_cov_2.677503_2_plen_196_part_00